MTAAPIRAISFDLWVTLIRSDPRFKPLRNEHLRATFAPRLDAAEFDAALRDYDKQADVLAEQTGADYGFTERLALLFAGLGVPFDPADPAVTAAEAEQDRLTRLYHPLPYAETLPALVADLATRVPLAVTSNTGFLPGSLMRDLLDQAGFAGAFSVLTFSNEVGASKPTPGIFAATFAGLQALIPDLTPEQVLHVGDNPVADIDGGTGFGMQTAHVNASDAEPVADLLTLLVADLPQRVHA